MSPIIQVIRNESLPLNANGNRKRTMPRGSLARIAEHCGTSSSTVLAWFRGATPREKFLPKLKALCRMMSAKQFEIGVDRTGKMRKTKRILQRN